MQEFNLFRERLRRGLEEDHKVSNVRELVVRAEGKDV